jgi:Ca2+-binding RTX toxin-like protein
VPSVMVVVQPLTKISRTRLAALAVSAGVAALTVPTAANAAVASRLDSPTAITMTGDAGADTILLADAGGLLTHNQVGNGFNSPQDFDNTQAGDQTVPADGSVTVNLLGGGGNDTITASAATVATANIDGGDGDDIITGSPKNDTITGGAGNDRITGFKNSSATPEVIQGGDGNDVMIWNNGDGNDSNDGGQGTDTALITNGAADDVMNVTAAGGGAHHFARTNAPFTVDTTNTTERLDITSFAGNDTLSTGPGVTLAMHVDAGPGDDTIATGDGADLIEGGDGNDTLGGGAGGDRIVGDRGNDTMNGGAGDDTLVWNNGDGSDVMNGDDGVDRIENNLSAGDDTSTLKVENGRVRYDRINAPFSLSVASSEVFALNTLGGNDSLTTAPGIGIAVVADGGAGNDTLKGADEADTFFGGSGDDSLDTGAGHDVADGGDGNDLLSIRDGAADLARGGAGADKAVADAIDAVAADVESVDRLLPGVARVGKTIKVSKRTALVKLACPAGTSGCNGTVVLTRTIRAGKLKAVVTLGRARFYLRAGETKALTVRLARGTAQLAKKHPTARVLPAS